MLIQLCFSQILTFKVNMIFLDQKSLTVDAQEVGMWTYRENISTEPCIMVHFGIRLNIRFGDSLIL